MIFQKYGSITNSYQKRTMDYLRNMPIANQNCWWVTEKIHGSNMGIWYDGENLRFSKRGSFIEGENFYGHVELLDNDEIRESMHALWEDWRDPEWITVYGEICGPGVQKGVDYGEKAFFAFDIAINNDYASCEQFADCNLFGIKRVPFIARDLSLDDALAISPDFDSKVLNKEGNKAEGLVIKPNEYHDFGNGSRVILKNKNDKFSEISSKKVKVVEEVPEDVKERLEEVAPFFTLNRLNNVISKEGEFSPKQFGRFSGLLVQDVLKEWGKEEGHKSFKRACQNMGNEIVREYMKENQ